jgi:Uncharacterised nucleotidyltransferase
VKTGQNKLDERSVLRLTMVLHHVVLQAMDWFLSLSRQAFRSLHHLPLDAEPAGLPEEAQERWRSWARRHRVQGLLFAGLPEFSGILQSAAYGQAQHTARFTVEAERLATRLSPTLPSLTLQKGPALAVQAWPDLGLRCFDDLDFVCNRRDYPALMRGMKDAGYMPEISDPQRRAHRWRYGWSIAFHHPDGFMVEVNHQFFPPQYPWPPSLTIRKDAPFVQQPLQEQAVRAPAPGLHLLLCCMHAIWHGWARLEWLVDIAGLLVRHPDALAQANTLAGSCLFARRAVAAGCGIAEALFGPDLTAEPIPTPSIAVLKQAVGLLEGSTRPMNGRELRTFHEQFMTPREKVAYRTRRVLIPGDGDFLWVTLPVPLRGLYWFLRPARVLLYGKTGY